MADHITINPAHGTHVVRAGDTILGRSDGVLEPREGGSAPRLYVPRADIDMALLTPSPRRSTCPWKGEASYFSVTTPAANLPDAVWSYESPKPACAAIAGHLSFYPVVTVEKV